MCRCWRSRIVFCSWEFSSASHKVSRSIIEKSSVPLYKPSCALDAAYNLYPTSINLDTIIVLQRFWRKLVLLDVSILLRTSPWTDLERIRHPDDSELFSVVKKITVENFWNLIVGTFAMKLFNIQSIVLWLVNTQAQKSWELASSIKEMI